MRAGAPRTLYRKIWDQHVIDRRGDLALLYVDRHIVHEGSFNAFRKLRDRGAPIRRPAQTFGTADHYVPTVSRSAADAPSPEIRRMVDALAANSAEHGFTAFPLGDARQGIVHVVGPEQGITLPGLVMVCGDSHTSTHGALGALAFGIGQTESEHVLATQAIWQAPSKTMRITINGVRKRGVTAKDVILTVIGKTGIGGAAGHVIEYGGSTIRAMSIEERLTVCNMSIEAGARAGMVAPDEVTFAYIAGRPLAPQGELFERAVAAWSVLPSDRDAEFDAEISLAADDLEPMVTWGTNPSQVMPISGAVPGGAVQALQYMGLEAGTKLEGIAVDQVFIGSCTNGRIEDLRAAADIARGKRAQIPAIVVPGSEGVRRQAEAEGLDRIFMSAGFEWRHSGCSMCVGMNGDLGRAGQRIASTSNRNFEGRQGRGVRTHLMSPPMAVAAAVTGRLQDVRRLES